jgi:hypothetical protein
MAYENDYEAHCLARTYNLLPVVKCHATGGHQVVFGMCEPDHNVGAETRCMVLAHWFDHTNILVKYKPAELEYEEPPI